MKLALNTSFMREVGYARWTLRTIARQFHKRILRHEHTLTLPNGERMVLPPDSRSATEAYVTGANVDWGSEELLRKMMTGAGAFLDIGANIGYYSLYMLGSVESIYAFEPDPRMRTRLERNVGNRAEIRIVDKAVAENSGTAKFMLAAAGEVSHIADGQRLQGREIVVDVVTVDEFVGERQLRVEGIKTDVEGFDLQVLLGARETMRQQRPIIVSELAPSPHLARLAAEVGYAIMGYVREHASRRISFAHSPTEMAGRETKMLFLVPDEKAQRLGELS